MDYQAKLKKLFEFLLECLGEACKLALVFMLALILKYSGMVDGCINIKEDLKKAEAPVVEEAAPPAPEAKPEVKEVKPEPKKK